MPRQNPKRPDRDSRARKPAASAPTWNPDPTWALPAALGVVALATLALLVVGFAWHPIGDHFTESDFYNYATGGRLIARGVVDFGRWSVIGPVYECLMAVPALLGVSAFGFAKALSVACAAVVMLAWLAIVRRRAGGLAALVTVTLLGANAVFFRYGYSSTTDVPAVALQAVALWALLAWRHRAAPWVAGAAAALAVLTRYNSAFLLPGAVAAMLLDPERDAPARRRALVAWFAAFTIVLLPWTAVSRLNGHWPGEALFANASFFASSSAAARNAQDARDAGEAGGGEAVRSGALARALANVPAHLHDDARQLLGWPAAVLVLLGAAAAALSRERRAWLPLSANVVLAFAALVPVFYSDRYSLAVLPGYLAFAGAAVASPRLSAWAGRAAAWVPLALVAWPLAASLQANVRVQRFVHSQLPRDVLATAPALRAERRPGDALISRKGALAWQADVRTVPFPRVSTLAELAAHARENRARFLYYSWYEGMLRPEFWYLLDTTAVVPGLERIASVVEPAAVLYRIGPELGREPAWMADSSQAALHVARGQVRALEDRDCWEAHAVLAQAARRAGDWADALAHAEAMTRGRPADTRGWVMTGDLRVAAGDLDGAREAYGRASAIQPGSAGARIGVGRIHRARRDDARAADAWRPVIEAAGDSATLQAMLEVFASRDTAAAARVRRALATLAVRVKR